MSNHRKDSRTKTQLLEEVERLQFRLQEAEETLEAIRSAEVDALVVAGPEGERVFSITGAEHIYRVIVETVNEAALTVDPDGTILFCNQRFCDLMKTPIQEAMGHKVTAFVARPQQAPLKTFLAEAQAGPVQRRLTLRATDGSTVPVQLAASPLQTGGRTSICLVASDLTELEASAQSIRVLREHQQALEESEARFRTMFEASQDAIVITDDTGVYVQANPAVRAIFGLSPDQLLGRKVSEFLDDTLDFPAFWGAFLTVGGFHGELGLIDAQGQRHDADFSAVTNVLPGRHMAVVRDITERKQAQHDLEEMNYRLQVQTEELEEQTEELRVQTEELFAANTALRQSEERLRLAQQAGRVGVFDRDLQNNTVVWTPELEELFGFPPGTFVGKPEDWARWVYPEDLPRMRSFLQEWLQSERTEETWEYRFIRADGQVRWMEGRGRIFRDPNGKPLRLIGTNVDITERKQAEEALRESEEKFRTLHALSPIAVVLNRLDNGQFLESNQALWDMTGYTEEEFRSLSYWDITPIDYKDMEAKQLELLHTVGRYGPYEKEYIRKDGTRFPVLLSGVRIKDPTGTDLIYSVIQDITELKAKDQAIRESREDLNRAQAVAQTGSWRLDIRHNVLLWSDETYRIFGLPQETLMTYETFLAAVHPDDRQYVDQQWTAALRGQPYDIAHRIVAGDTVKWVRERAELEFDRDGGLLGGFGTVQDITERKQAEEALRAKQVELELILHRTPFMLTRCSRDLRYRYVSRAYAEMIGRTPEQVAGKSILEIMGDEGFETIRPYVEAVLQGQPVEYEAPVHFQGVGPRFLHVAYVPDKDEQGHVIGWIASIVDMSERKQAEEALRESEERFHRLFEEDLTADFISTPEGRILLCNPAFARIFGFSSALEAVGTNIVDLYLDPREREPLLTRLKQQKKIERLEVWRKRRDGEPIYVVENLVGHFNEREELYEVKGYVFDDTERKRAEEALRELNTTLESRVAQRTAELQHRARQLQKLTLELSETEDRERRQLAEVLHDDLQQQLAAAKFHLSLLNSRAKHDPAQLALVTQVDQMLMEAIQKSRNLSHELSPTVLYHADFAGALNWLAGQLHAKHGLEVAVDAFGEVNVQSEALKTFLYKAAQELLFNVVKHARVNQARIRVRRFGRCICLSVSDRGRGFDPQELRQAAGFGLFSIRERIELLGGRMKIHSAKGHGTTFHIVIPDGSKSGDTVGVGPRAYPTSATPDDHGATEGGHGGPPLRVLLADDHGIVRAGLRSLLSDEHDVQVVGEAANGREAVDQAYRLQPDVVIMDVAMPLINGDDATRQIKMHLPQTRVIALSMYEEPDVLERMRRAGAEDYILKTAPSEELLAAIRGQAHAEVTA